MSHNMIKLWLWFFWKSQFGRSYWISTYKKKLKKISICDHAFSQKSQFKKHLESVHSNIKSHNCSVCDLGFSRIDILERHANHFYEERMSQDMIKLWLWFFWKSQFGRSYGTSFYKKGWKRSLSCKNILNLVQYVI